MNRKHILPITLILTLAICIPLALNLSDIDSSEVEYLSMLKENQQNFASYDSMIYTVEEAFVESYAVVIAKLNKVEMYDHKTFEYYFSLEDYVSGNIVDDYFMTYSYDLELQEGMSYCLFLNEEFTGNSPAPTFSIAYDMFYVLDGKKIVSAYSDVPISDLLDYKSISKLKTFSDKTMKKEKKYTSKKFKKYDDAINSSQIIMKVLVQDMFYSNKYNYMYNFELIEDFSTVDSLPTIIISGKKLEVGDVYYILMDNSNVLIKDNYSIIDSKTIDIETEKAIKSKNKK